MHAEIILREGVSISADVLIEHVKARLGSYKAPKSVTFVDELPMSSVGKVLRRKIRDRYWVNQDRRL